MISTSYIHEYAPHDQFMYESHYLLLESKDILTNLVKLENTIDEKTYFGESVENEILVMESEKKNIFTRIGEKIIEIFNSFINLLKDMGKSIKDSITGIRKKTSDDAYMNAMADNPKLAEDFLKGVMSGNIKAHDVKDLNMLLDEATRISNELANGTIDEKKFGDKIDDMLDKFGKRAKNITAILGVVASVAGVAKGVAYLKGKDKDSGKVDELDRLNKEVNTFNAIQKMNATKDLKDHYIDKYKKLVEESAHEPYNGSYFSESVSITDTLKKIMNFFTDHITFCSDATEKLESLKNDVISKLKTSKDSKDGSAINTVTAGIQKVMGVISKELNTVKNTASKLDAKVNKS